MQNLADNDTEQIFLDWGVPATLEEIQSYYDPDTGQMEESATSTPMSVIASPVESIRQELTAAVQSVNEVMLIARTNEIPGSVNLMTARIVIGTQTFSIDSIVTSQVPNTVVLNCKSISG